MQGVAQSGTYLDRKRTLPKRVAQLALRVAQLTPGEYVIVLTVPEPGQDITWREAQLPGDRQKRHPVVS